MADATTPSSGEVIIRTENLGKTYRTGTEDLLRLPGVTALHNLNMEVHRGEVFAMIGPNGSGKTTTLKLLMGLIFPTRGTARLFDRNPRTDVSVKRRIGFMPDGPYFYGHLNGYELLEFYANLLGMPPAMIRRRVPELVEMVGMANRAKQRVRTYSKGMVQRVGLAHALLNDPEIVFMDEPTSGLDPIGARDIRDVIRRMKDEGRTVFLCSHFLTEIEGLCDRVILLDRGRTLRYGSLEDLLVEADKMRVTASGLTPEAIDQWQALGRFLPGEAPGEPDCVVVSDGADTNAAIGIVQQSGAHLDALAPMRRTLEEVFMEAVERTQADQPWAEQPAATVAATAEPEPVAEAAEAADDAAPTGEES